MWKDIRRLCFECLNAEIEEDKQVEVVEDPEAEPEVEKQKEIDNVEAPRCKYVHSKAMKGVESHMNEEPIPAYPIGEKCQHENCQIVEPYAEGGAAASGLFTCKICKKRCCEVHIEYLHRWMCLKCYSMFSG